MYYYAFTFFRDSYLTKAKERPMWRGWRILGDCLVILTYIQQILNNRPSISDHFNTYSHTMRLVTQNPTQFQLNEEKQRLFLLLEMITVVQQTLFVPSTSLLQVTLSTCHFYKNIIQSWCQELQITEYSSNKQFIERFRTIISDSLYKWDQVAQQDIPDRHRLMVLCCLTLLHCHIAPSPDKKLIKQLCGTQKRIVAFHLIGDILFVPGVFLQTNLPQNAFQYLDKNMSKQSLSDAMNLMLNQQMENLQRETQLGWEIVQEWKVEMKNVVPETSNAGTNGTANQLAVVRLNTLLKVSSN